MKRTLSIVLALALALAFAACGASSSSAPSASSGSASASAQPKDYVQIILDARSDDYNEAYHIFSKKSGEEAGMGHAAWELPEEEAKNTLTMTNEMFGLDEALLDAYAYSISLMNVKAYGVGIFKPAEGKAQQVTEMLNNYVSAQQKAQESYLVDQYEIAKAAVVKELPGGEIILVMSEDAQNIASSMEAALK